MSTLRYPLVERQHDPDFDYTEIRTWDGDVVHSFPRCLHANVLPVISLGDTVAQLCIDCDAQLPDWWS